MAKSKKKNPSKIPVSKADIEKAKRQASNLAVAYTSAIFLSALAGKEGFGKVRLSRVWDSVCGLSEGISQGYVSVPDLIDTLKEEQGINVCNLAE